MPETTETRTVQKYRHEARRQLKQGQERLSLRTDATHEVYQIMNGAISHTLRGIKGLSQEEQVERLAEARDQLQGNLEGLSEKLAAARQSVMEQLDSWETDIQAKADEAVATLEEARVFAAERDFEAHQNRKQRGFVPPYEAPTSEADDEDDEDEADDNS